MKSVNLKSVTGMSYAISEICERRQRDAEVRVVHIGYTPLFRRPRKEIMKGTSNFIMR